MHQTIFTSTPTDNSSGFRRLGFGRRAEYFKWARLSSNPMFYESTETTFWSHCEQVKGSSILVPIVTARSVHITIELESTTSKIDQLNHMIEQVFQKQDTGKRIAAYWRPVPEDQASATLPAGAQVTGMLEGNRSVYRALAGIIPPQAVHMEAPTFTQSAREKRLQGTAVVSVVVNETGLPEILEVTKDLGEGLDIQSLLTVAEWRFRPATLNGQPVAVKISVVVSFRLF